MHTYAHIYISYIPTFLTHPCAQIRKFIKFRNMVHLYTHIHTHTHTHVCMYQCM